MSWCLRKPRTRCSVHPLPCPVGLPERLRRRAICRSGIKRANSRRSAIVSSGGGQWCRPTAFNLNLTCSAVWSPPRQCRTMLMTAPSLRTTISLSAVRKIRLRSGCGGWMRPGQLEIGAELHQLLSLPFAQWWRLGRDDGSDLAFYSVHGLQCRVPASLQLAGLLGDWRDRRRRIADGHTRPRNAPVEATAQAAFVRPMSP